MKRLHKRTANTAKTIEAYRCTCNTCPSCSASYACNTCSESTSFISQYQSKVPILQVIYSKVDAANSNSISNGGK